MDESKCDKDVVRPRDSWEIEEDLRAVKRTLAIFKDKERLKDMTNLAKEKKSEEESLDLLADGDIKGALGL